MLHPLAYTVEAGPILIGSAVVFILAILGFLVVKAVSKWMAKTDEGTVGVGFTLADLREMHRSGQMSSEEFEKAKAILLATMAKPAAKPKSTPDKTL